MELHLRPRRPGAKLTESWQFLPTGIAMFQEKYADQRRQTLAAIKQIAETC